MTDNGINQAQHAARQHLLQLGYSIQEVRAAIPEAKTLRDDLAMAAMQTLPPEILKYPQTDRFVSIAEHCYRQADAMLYVRGNRLD